MHMNESTGRKMGPREERWRRALDILNDQRHNGGVRPMIVRLRLADALEEAIDGWDNLICRFRGQDETLMQHADRVTRLRSLLKDVDDDMAIDIIRRERIGGVYPDIEGALASLCSVLSEVDRG
jgi:hypothetical protein